MSFKFYIGKINFFYSVYNKFIKLNRPSKNPLIGFLPAHAFLPLQ